MKRLLSFNEAFIDKAIALGAKLTDLYTSNAPAKTNPAVASTTSTPAAVVPNTKARMVSVADAVGNVTVSDARVSNNFSLYEFLKSDTAKNLKIADQDQPSPVIVENIRQFATKILDPLVNAGMKFQINSGWRSKALNDVLKGSSETSYHMSGLAADLHPINMDIYVMFDKIAAMTDVPYYELFLETGDGSKWIHISYEPTMSKAKKIRRSFSAY